MDVRVLKMRQGHKSSLEGFSIRSDAVLDV